MEVFGRANRWLVQQKSLREPAYSLEVVAEQAGTVACSSPGLALQAARSWREVQAADTLLVAGGIGWERIAADLELRSWLRAMQAGGARIASICTGALVLASAGLLDGKRATTHWDYCDRLAQLAPGCSIVPDAIYLCANDRLYTSAGVTAGMDLALALIQRDHDAALALEIAQQLVMFFKRSGSQPQRSRTLAAQARDHDRIAELQGWMVDHLDQDLSVPTLARRVSMSPRNFARRFQQTSALSPARYVEQLRLEAARRRLEESSQGLTPIAAEVGLGSAESLRRLFQRHLSMSPQQYRSQFSGA